uniref:Integrase zinc-binding domain-containing protein n=1 Tax=Ananas comosus var. bracteatus TaxID=296719 RepID=A0A6V7PXG7_ANACO|nr:unnamed protein product [Ananas comosus var. bracteatus]
MWDSHGPRAGGLEQMVYVADSEHCMFRDYLRCGIPEVLGQEDLSILHMWPMGRRCVPEDSDLRRDILSEAHRSPYVVHPGETKICRDLKQHFWWPGMKLDVAQHVARCLVCQQVKAEHQRPVGKLQPLPVPVWK